MTTPEKLALAAIIIPNSIALAKWWREESKSKMQAADNTPQNKATPTKDRADGPRTWPFLVGSALAVMAILWLIFDPRELTMGSVVLLILSCMVIVVTILIMIYGIIRIRLDLLLLQNHYIYEALHPRQTDLGSPNKDTEQIAAADRH